MSTEEFITQFDIFYNNIASNSAPSIDNYEKSVFLTQAQRDIVIELYNGRGIPGISFESTEEARLYLRELTTSKDYTSDDFTLLSDYKKGVSISSIELPEDLWFVTMEEVNYSADADQNGCLVEYNPMVVPVRQDYLNRVLKNPFKGPSENRILRVDLESKIRLYSKYAIDKYTIYYIKSPNPIILEPLNGVTIEGESWISECELNPILHRAILERAVYLAKMAYIGKQS